MLFFADRTVSTSTSEKLERIEESLSTAVRLKSGIEAHGKLVEAFVEASELAQGIADWETELLGRDGPGPAQDAVADLLMMIARAVATSWESCFSDISAVPISKQLLERWPDCVTCKELEGFAFYAVYPESFYEAGKQLRCQSVDVIGLRSIGFGLAAMVAVGAQARSPISVRPFGNPFERQVDLSSFTNLAQSRSAAAIVDEGPGLSGSSFAAAAEAIDSIRGPDAQILFLPSHSGEPGAQASTRIRSRWRDTTKINVPFERLLLESSSRGLGTWFSELTGSVDLIEDISAGAWESKVPTEDVEPPLIDPQRERRKYLLHTPRGTFLAKFVGFGRQASIKFKRARILSDAGFAIRPLALRHGFWLEPWLSDARRGFSDSSSRKALIKIAEYLSFRAHSFPCNRSEGATLAELNRMMRVNVDEALGCAPPFYSDEEIASLDTQIRRVATDNRMHSWEWLSTAQQVLKTDAVDHCAAHDLIGCQDIAWDVAAAICEFDLSSGERSELIAQMKARGIEISAKLLQFYSHSYAAIQLATWSFDHGTARRAIDKYSRSLRENMHEVV